MTVSDLREELRQLTKMYFTGADVTFTKQSFIAKPTSPLISLTMGVISRPINPPIITIDGRPVAVYPASTAIQIDLFTNGKQTETAKGFTPLVENTAAEDLLGFIHYNADVIEADRNGESPFDYSQRAVEEIRAIKDKMDSEK